MFTRVKSATIIGIDASIIEIEVDLKKGLPQQSIVGLADTAVKEAKERVNSAIRNAGFDFPLGKLTINLAPADLRKEGSTFDLAIAIGTLAVSKQLAFETGMDDFLILGELALDGRLRPVHGVLAILEAAKKYGTRGIILPSSNSREAELVSGIEVYPVERLEQAADILTGKLSLSGLMCVRPVVSGPGERQLPMGEGRYRQTGDYSDIKGQSYAIRAAEIAAAGGHNLLLIGSPGSGKTMIASRMPTILPAMDEREAVETTKIYSVAGLLTPPEGLMTRRPFRSPHHTASEISIVGGGKNPIPGEITLAHNGILFLDEFTEFRRNIIQSLRQPMESGRITIARADRRVSFPARFMLVASMNPCPCGYLFDPEKVCRCSDAQIGKYYMKLSGPILDRIDIQVEVRPLAADEILDGGPAEGSESIGERVKKARLMQYARLGECGVYLNAHMSEDLVKKYCVLDKQMEEIIYAAVRKYRLSARSYCMVLKVARTIADIGGRERLELEDLLEALSYREVEQVLSSGRARDVESAG
jgi:magnesium chelatase family protein